LALDLLRRLVVGKVPAESVWDSKGLRKSNTNRLWVLRGILNQLLLMQGIPLGS